MRPLLQKMQRKTFKMKSPMRKMGMANSTLKVSPKAYEQDTFRKGLGVYQTTKSGGANRVGGIGRKTLPAPMKKVAYDNIGRSHVGSMAQGMGNYYGKSYALKEFKADAKKLGQRVKRGAKKVATNLKGRVMKAGLRLSTEKDMRAAYKKAMKAGTLGRGFGP